MTKRTTIRPYRRWSASEEAWLIQNYPVVSWGELEEKFPDMSRMAIQSKARTLDLYRDKVRAPAGRPRKFKTEDIAMVRDFAPHYHEYRAKRDALAKQLSHLTKNEIRYLLVQYAKQEEW